MRSPEPVTSLRGIHLPRKIMADTKAIATAATTIIMI